MIFDPHMFRDPGVADQFSEFVALIGPVQARRHQDRHSGQGHAGGDQGLDHGAQEQMVGHGPGDVADQDTRALSAARKLTERPQADRLFKRAGDRRYGAQQPRQGALVGRALRVSHDKCFGFALRSRTGCRSCASSGWVWPTLFLTQTRSGLSARR